MRQGATTLRGDHAPDRGDIGDDHEHPRAVFQIPEGGVAFVGDVRVRAINPDVPRIQELGPDGLPAVLR